MRRVLVLRYHWVWLVGVVHLVQENVACFLGNMLFNHEVVCSDWSTATVFFPVFLQRL